MTTPVVFSCSLEYPAMAGSGNVDAALEFSAAYANRADFVYNLIGAGTQVIDFGALATGAKLLWVSVDASTESGAAAVTLTLNEATPGVELPPGGFAIVGNPSPTAGITSASLTHTTAAVVRVKVLG